MVLGLLSMVWVFVEHWMQKGEAFTIGRFESLACYAFLLTLAYVFLVRRRDTQLLAGLLAPLITIVLLLGGGPMFVSEGDVSFYAHNLWVGTHVGSALISYALFSLAAVVAVAYLVMDHNLKNKRLDGLFARLPSLETLDGFLAWQVGIAFASLTLSILIGGLLVRLSGGGEEWITDPKIIATSVAWAVYAVLVHLRASLGRRGRSLAVICVIGASCMLFAFVGVALFTESLHRGVSFVEEAQP
ncbi:MAG: cytochrome c biogenesis protein CcsA, partial [Kiritimatiellae bacterium]|nr:cytochrome c biogenesis protein CcsA [Kiritimatiellia bacterium]